MSEQQKLDTNGLTLKTCVNCKATWEVSSNSAQVWFHPLCYECAKSVRDEVYGEETFTLMMVLSVVGIVCGTWKLIEFAIYLFKHLRWV